MLSVEQSKKILGDEAKNLTDEQIEAMRDELYIAANLAFAHWQHSNVSAKGDVVPSPFAGALPVLAGSGE